MEMENPFRGLRNFERHVLTIIDEYADKKIDKCCHQLYVAVGLSTNYSFAMSCASSSNELETVKCMLNQIEEDYKEQAIQKAFTEASCFGCLTVVEYLVSVGADVSANHNEALDLAATSGHLETVKYLVSMGATYKEDTLASVFEHEHMDTANYLVSIGAGVTEHADETLFCCSQVGNMEMIQYLVSQGVSITDLSFIVAVENGHLELIKFALSTYPSQESKLSLVRSCQNEAIWSACYHNHFEVVQYLVSVGADITDDQNMCLISTCEQGHLDITKYAISLGADVSARDYSAFVHASRHGQMETLRYLVSLTDEKKTTHEMVTTQDNLAIVGAAERGFFEVVEYLISVGADINAQDNEAMRMAMYNHHDCLKLLSLGAKIPSKKYPFQ